MVEFVAPASVPDRHIACRLSMMVGIGGPLAWEAPTDPADPFAPFIPSITTTIDGLNHWDLGAGFVLIDLGESAGFRMYRLTHPELTHELHNMQQFIEWTLDQRRTELEPSITNRKNPCRETETS